MTLFADLHIHSKYARGTSINMDLEHAIQGGGEKGLGLLGTGDFTHPVWFKELKAKLEPVSGQEGFYQLRGSSESAPKFMLQVEVATFKSDPKQTRKVHHVICVSSFDEAAQLRDLYGKWGNLAADGRPMFGNRSCADFVEQTKQACPHAVVFPAHAFTPYFGVFGSKSGFDSLEEAYEEQVKHIFCFETGMSADPAMCWRLSRLDKYTPVSFSDSHSFWPWRIGRECNAFADSVNSFDGLWSAVKQKDRAKFLFTVETDPAYGKYHWDGHRNCNFSCSPAESKKLNNICPVCKRPLTIGVEYRIEELADRPVGFVPRDAIPFKKLIPLHELIAAVYSTSLSSKKVMGEGARLIRECGSELNVLLDAPREKLLRVTEEKIVDTIMINREGKIAVKPGYDGEYGVPQIAGAEGVASENSEKNPAPVKQRPAGLKQKSLGDW